MEFRVVAMRRRTLCTAGLAFAVVVQVASSAAAVPLVGGELRVRRTEAASDCPDELALSASTMALAGPATEASSSPLEVDVVLDRDESGYVARIDAQGRKSGEREIRSTSEQCTGLADATSVALAILFDLLPAQPAASEPSGSLPSREPARQAVPPVAEPVVAPSKPPGTARALVVGLAMQGGLASGLLGHALTEHLGAALRVRVSRRLELGAGAFWAPGRAVSHGPGTVSVSLVAGRGDVTVSVVENGGVELGVRAGISAGALRGNGAGYDHDHEAMVLWLAPGVGAVGRWRVSRRWAFTLSTTLLMPHRSQTFSVEEVPGTAFEGAPAAVLFELGPELALF